jgi:adenine-specific DNA-methyltransferase
MTRRLTERTKANARSLRRGSTDAEARLWYNLRRHELAGYKFRRQHPFGPYILDFYCAKARLVIEVDGGQHMDAKNAIADAERTAYLKQRGLRVLRFNNRQALLQTNAVLEIIYEALTDPSP